MNSWEEIAAKLMEAGVEPQPEVGQTWVLREDAYLRKILDPEEKLPKKVVISSVEPPTWGRFNLKIRVTGNKDIAIPQGEVMEIDCFETLYEVYRPSVWERIT